MDREGVDREGKEIGRGRNLVVVKLGKDLQLANTYEGWLFCFVHSP